MNTIHKIAISLPIGLLASLGQKYGILAALVCSAILLDLSTGIIKGKITKTINSNKGWRGFWKKMALLAALAFGLFLDSLEAYLLAVHFNGFPGYQVSFAMLIGVYIILNESISICENLVACGVKLPRFIMLLLKKAQEQLDEENQNGVMDKTNCEKKTEAQKSDAKHRELP